MRKLKHCEGVNQLKALHFSRQSIILTAALQFSLAQESHFVSHRHTHNKHKVDGEEHIFNALHSHIQIIRMRRRRHFNCYSNSPSKSRISNRSLHCTECVTKLVGRVETHRLWAQVSA